MDKKKDPNYIVKLEKAITKKYGKETIQNPRGNWGEEKEKEYREQIKKIQARKDHLEQKNEKIEVDGVFISKKLLNKETIDRTCSVCGKYSFDTKDDVYMIKDNCCHLCYYTTRKILRDAQERKENQKWQKVLKFHTKRLLFHMKELLLRFFGFFMK